MRQEPPAWLDDAPLPDGEDDYGNVVRFPGVTAGPEFSGLSPSHFTWRAPSDISPRQWLYGHHLIRKYVSATIAPGGVGKSTLTVADAVAMAAGRSLLGPRPHGKLRVWLWNGEDPREEMERRVIATCIAHGVDASGLDDRLLLDSGRDMPIKIGTAGRDGVTIAAPVVDALSEAIKRHRIDVLVVDPFVSVHSLPENDNGAMDAAVKAFALVADRTGCAIDLVHHARKLNGAEADIDSARGGSAIAGAVRAARALNPMSKEAADGFGISGETRRSYVRVDDAKANLAPASAARWIKLDSVALGNGTIDRPEDYVAVARSWKPPEAFDGVTVNHLRQLQDAIHGEACRANVQSDRWIGHKIGKVLDFDPTDEAGKAKVKALLKMWLASGALVRTYERDLKGNDRPVIEVGEWAT